MNERSIAPSILSADLLHLEDQIKSVEKRGADFIHVDIMDGHFVPNITFGPVIVSTLNRITDLPLDVHLMINNVDQYIPQFVEAGADILTIHQEAGPHLHRSVQLIKDLNIKAGVSLNPATEVSTIKTMLPEMDLVLLMSVNPGFGGQSYISAVNDKLKQLSKIKKENHYSFLIEVDGGINAGTIQETVRSGAQVLVAGNAIFAQTDPGSACENLKKMANDALT